MKTKRRFMKTLKQQTEKIQSDTEQIKAIGKEMKEEFLTWDKFIKEVEDENYSTQRNDEMNLEEVTDITAINLNI